MRSALPVLLVLAAPIVLPAFADEGRIPIYQPTSITTPGHYVVTRNISIVAGDVIRIASNNVALDLNGHTLSSSATTGNIVSVSAGLSEVSVRNGRLSGGSHGVHASDGNRVRLERLEISDSADAGIRLAHMDFAEVLSCRVVGANSSSALGTDLGAIHIDGTPVDGRVDDNTVISTFFDGIRLEGLQSGEVARNVVLSPSLLCSSCGSGLLITGNGGNHVESNILRDGRGPGMIIASPGSHIHKNSVTGNAEGGISIASNGNQVLENVVVGNGDNLDGPWGIIVSGSDNRIKGNEVQGNLGHGIHIAGGSRNLIDDNLIEGHSTLVWCGIQFDNGPTHAYRNNMLRGNAGGTVCGVANTNAGGNIL